MNVLADPMNPAGSLEARELTEEIRRLEGLHGAFDRRTRGITWMIWGLILPGIYLSYSYAGATMLAGARLPVLLFLTLWIPWVALGVLVTGALWRSAGLLIRGARPVWNGLKAFLVFVGVTVSAYLAYHFLELYKLFSLVGPSVMLMLVGLGTLVLGFNRWACPDRVERTLWTLGGLLLLLVVIVGTLVVGPVPHDAEPAAFVPALRAFSVIAPLATAAVYVGNGLYLSVRG